MKFMIIITLVFSFYTPNKAVAGQLNPIAGQPQTCPVSSAETLVCSVVICNPIGLAIAKSRSKCLRVNRKFAIYLATLGFWSKPPSCKSRDQNCNKTGKASKAQISTTECTTLNSVYEQKACLSAITGQVDQDFCNLLSGDKKNQCLAKLPPPVVPKKPIDCGLRYSVSEHVDTLSQCIRSCFEDSNTCVRQHSNIDCSKQAPVGSWKYDICRTECSHWNMCVGGEIIQGFNDNFSNDFEKNFKQ